MSKTKTENKDLAASPVDALVSVMEQPKPNGEGPEIGKLVIGDIESRIEKGIKTYGEPLKAYNGRNPLIDAYQEALDLAIYLRQAIEEAH